MLPLDKKVKGYVAPAKSNSIDLEAVGAALAAASYIPKEPVSPPRAPQMYRPPGFPEELPVPYN